MKINLGSSKLKKSFFPISFDSSTTSNFGECIPTFCHEVVSDSHVNIDLRSAVRFAPLTLPTFGKAYLHNYAFYHKFVDLWSPFNDMLAGTPFTSGSGQTYIPTRVPWLTLADLWFIVLNHCSWSFWDVSRANVSNPQASPLNVGNYTISPHSTTLSPLALQNGFAATVAAQLGSSVRLQYLTSSNRRTNLISDFSTDLPNTFIPHGSVGSSEAITPAGSDFMIYTSQSKVYKLVSSVSGIPEPIGGGTSNSLLICCKLNNSGKLLRKIFMGLGYQLKNIQQSVNILPLFAFFKSYFSTFAPKRFLKYEQTAFGRLMTSVINNGSDFATTLFYDTYTNGSLCPQIIDELLSCFYTEDTDYYSSQIIGMVNDYGTNLNQMYLGVDSDTGSVMRGFIGSDMENNAVPGINFNDSDGTPPGDTMLHTQAQQNILSRLTNFVNRRSLVGGKISELLESMFGIPKSDVLCEDNPYIGSNVIDVDFSDVFSTAETQEGSLGEYAGKAIGIGSSDKLSVNCSSPGVVLVFSTIVPRTQKVQGVNPNLFHTQRYDFYNPAFDGLTLLPSNRYSLYCVDSIADTRPDGGLSFGNQSLFAEYKTRTQGILNGDLSLVSTKSTYDSFTLDQTIANYVVQDPQNEADGSIKFALTSPNSSNWTAGTMWRYIGRWLWLGNYDRIFVNTRQFYSTDYADYSNVGWQDRDTHVTDDNLIIHNVVDLKINAPMLPLEDSYMTKDLEELENGVGTRSQSE